MKLSYLIALLILSSPAARSAIVDPEQIKPIDEIPSLKCAANEESTSWYLSPLPTNVASPKPTDIHKDIQSITAPQYDSKAGLYNGLRLDGCADAQTNVKLKRVLYGDFIIYELASTDTSITPSTLLGEDLANMDYSKFNIRVTNKSDDIDLQILGVNKNSVAIVKNLSRGRVSGEAYVGVLEVGNPFTGSTGPCKAGTHLEKGSQEFSTVKLDYETCTAAGTSGTNPYTLIGLTITDSSSSVPVGLRGVPQKFEQTAIFAIDLSGSGEPPNTISERVRYRVIHHNACDSMVIDAPRLNATYALTSTPITRSCGAPISGAEAQGILQDDFTLIRIDYNGQKGTPFKANFRHYFNAK